MLRNITKSLISRDRYGVEYIKNFKILAGGIIVLQKWTSENLKIKTVYLGQKEV